MCAKNNQGLGRTLFKNVKSKEHIIDLGKKLYVKITEVIASEVEAVTEKDCIAYIFDLVIKRTFDGYTTDGRYGAKNLNTSSFHPGKTT